MNSARKNRGAGKETPPILKGLAEIDGAGAEPDRQGRRSLPPVHLWNPPYCGDIPITIKRDGVWLYQGSPIGRKPMVRLFSSILRKDDGRFYLVTPVEKCGIKVEDAPFVAVELTVLGSGKDQILQFRTHVDDLVEAGDGHEVRVETDPLSGEPSPYVHVRAGLEALISRPVYYQLADLAVPAETGSGDVLGVWSKGRFFELGRADEGA